MKRPMKYGDNLVDAFEYASYSQNNKLVKLTEKLKLEKKEVEDKLDLLKLQFINDKMAQG